MKIIEAVTAVALAITLMLVLSLIYAIPTWLLWNWLVVSIFTIREITLIEAWGLLILCGFLFNRTPYKGTQS